MLRIEIKTHKNGKITPKVTAENLTAAETLFSMEIIYDIFKSNDTSGTTDKEILEALQNFHKIQEKNRKEKK